MDAVKPSRSFTLTVLREDAGERLDRFLGKNELCVSRSFAEKLIEAGEVLVNGKPQKPGYRLREGDEVKVSIPEAQEPEAKPEDIPLDVIYEDEDILVVNKPWGMVVHPAPGNPRGTLVNALLAHTGGLSSVGGVLRPGIVHRLDKDTSGIIVVCKNDAAHLSFSQQLKDRSITKIYLAIVHGVLARDEGEIDAPIGRHPSNRKKMACLAPGKGRPALTRFRVEERFLHHSFLRVFPKTGRTHQIRVHLAHIGHPIVGDPVYGGKRKDNLGLERQALHAWRIAFIHPRTGRLVEFEAPLPDDLRRALARLRSDLPLCAIHGEGAR